MKVICDLRSEFTIYIELINYGQLWRDKQQLFSSAGFMPGRTLCWQMRWNVHNNQKPISVETCNSL